MVNTLFARIYHNLTILHPSHLPRDGPAIVVSNHISGLDPLLIQSACRYRLITWMMAREYMELPAMGRIFRVLGVIPVDRGSRETGPLRRAFRQLDNGRIIGIFPEGKIAATRELLPFQTGVALMAIRSNVPVHPVYLDGTQRNKEMGQAFFQRTRAIISFGPEVEFDRSETSKEKIDAATDAIKSAVFKLRLEVDNFRKLR